MSDPYEYNVERLDKLIEEFRNASLLHYGKARAALWQEIRDSQLWHQANGFKEGQTLLINGMKQFVEERNKGR